MCTFGDLMALLLCFFIMLYAISIIAEPRVQALADTLNQDFEGFAGSGRTVTQSTQTIAIPADSAARARRVSALAGGQPTPGPIGEDTQVYAIPLDGETVRNGVIRFELGSYELTLQNQWHLRTQVLPILEGSPQKIMVKGYTAPIEAGGTFDGTELAFFRALAVVDYFVERHGLDQGYFEIAFEPGAAPRLALLPAGTDPEHAGASVEILLLNQMTRALR